MLLAIDIGNSTIGAALFPENADSLLPLENIPTDAQFPRGEYAAVFRARLQSSGADPRKITAAIASSVVPALTDPFLGMVEECTGVKPLLVNPSLYHLLPVTMPEARAAQIGTDIVCNAVEARARFRGPCVIVNFGTALTFTAVGSAGEILGAAIAPGLGIALRSLASGAAQLYTVPLEVPSSPLGGDTVSAIQSGVVFGSVGLAESLVSRFINEMCRIEGLQKDSIQVIATGGLCGLVAPLTGIFGHVDPYFIFHGLRRIAQAITKART